MRKVLPAGVILGLLLALVGAPFGGAGAVAQDTDIPLDIGNVPLPVQDLPEAGFQVMSGGYLDRDTAASWIAGPRERSATAIASELTDAGWLQSYVLSLVLLEDRAYPDSEVLSLVQTNVMLFADSDGAGRMYELMSDYPDASLADEFDPSVSDSQTVQMPDERGDTLRSVVLRDRVVLEIVSVEGFRFVDEAAHNEVVAGTVDRLIAMQEDDGQSPPGLMPQAARLTDSENLGDLQTVGQSGVHHLYRIRDGVTQPAAGELDAPSPDAIAAGMRGLYQGSEEILIDGGVAYMSTWIATFESETAAISMFDAATAGSPSAYLNDPYFPIASDEQLASQGIEGVYRVTGTYDGRSYSGTLELRQQENHVVAIGFRTIGSVLPPVDVTSRVMDHQLGCLGASSPCPPIDLADLLTAAMATPVVPASSEGAVTSEEFGWSLAFDPDTWTVTETFIEPGYDLVELQAGESLVTLEGVINQHGNPEQCIIDELRMLQEFESSAVIDLGSDDGAEAPAGLEGDHARALYTVEPLAEERADQEYVIRFDCYTLIDGGANLVMTHRAPRYAWDTERYRGEEIRAGLSFASSGRAGMLVATVRETWDEAA